MMISSENNIAEMSVPELVELMTQIMGEIELRFMQLAGEEEQDAE